MPHPTAIATSGALPMSEIRNWLIAAGELANTTTVSLESLVNASHLSDKTRPHNISLFYGYGVVANFQYTYTSIRVGTSNNVCDGSTGGNFPAASDISPMAVNTKVRIESSSDVIPTWGSYFSVNGYKYQISVDDTIAFTSTYRYYKVLVVTTCEGTTGWRVQPGSQICLQSVPTPTFDLVQVNSSTTQVILRIQNIINGGAYSYSDGSTFTDIGAYSYSTASTIDILYPLNTGTSQVVTVRVWNNNDEMFYTYDDRTIRLTNN